jgi:hypothetical protein
MASISEVLGDPLMRHGKCLGVGENGQGKSGSYASLICAGYQLRLADTDKGAKILWTLLTDDHYPYASYIRKHNIDIEKAVDVVQIDLDVDFKEVKIPQPGNASDKIETLLAPVNTDAWESLSRILVHWKDGKTDYGRIHSWDNNVVLGLDSTSTVAKGAYYFSQYLNGRLGARESGNTYQRDVGEAQSQLTRLLEMLFNRKIHCNVVCMGHITMIDTESGYIQAPEQIVRDESQRRRPSPKGYPSMIGRALSPKVGMYFNDLYEYKNYKINTARGGAVPTKSSVYLESSYPIETGLAQIMAAHTGRKLPDDFLECLAPKGATPNISTTSPSPAPAKPGGVTRPAPFRP